MEAATTAKIYQIVIQRDPTFKKAHFWWVSEVVCSDMFCTFCHNLRTIVQSGVIVYIFGKVSSLRFQKFQNQIDNNHERQIAVPKT